MFEQIRYEVAGSTFTGLLAHPTAAPRGGVLVLHGGGGLGAPERDRVQTFAALGFVGLAPDLLGEVFGDRARGLAVIRELVGMPELLRARVGAALDRLTAAQGVAPMRTAAVGHCFGGLAALELARSGAAVAAAVSFHGGLLTRAPARAGEVSARVLACSGADDPFCPRDQRAAFDDEMASAGVDWQHHLHGGARHGFTVAGIDPASHPGCAYHAHADRRSWRAMLDLLDEVMPAASHSV